MNIISDRLCLTSIAKENAVDIFEHFTPEVTRYMYPCPSKEISEVLDIISKWEEQYNEKTDDVYAITIKSTGEFVGVVALHHLKNDAPELGIWTKIGSHGNHYGREAVGALIEHSKRLGYKKLIYPVDKANIASKKIPLFYGGELIVKDKLIITPDGRTLNEEIYEIII